MCRKLFFLTCVSFSIGTFLSGQCPDRDWLWKRLVFLRDSTTSPPTEKLNELLTYEDRMKNCSYRFDSTHALLLQRIGAMYFYDADYLKAARYMQQAINIITVHIGSPDVNIKDNIRNYYSLAWIYDSLNNVTGKMKALDSCAAIAIRSNSIDIYCMQALNTRVEYFFDIGDYNRCISYATICEMISKKYSHRNVHDDYQTGLQFALISLFWRVNALLKLKNYKLAEDLLGDKMEECKKTGIKQYLGTIYQLFAELDLQQKNYKKAIFDYNKAFKYEQEAADNISCKVILSNIGYNIYFKHFNDINKAISYYRKALAYNSVEKSENISNVFESLKIFNYIADLYVRKNLFDSSFFYFQEALNQIKPGMTEATLLQSSINEFSSYKHIHYLIELLIDKGDALEQQYKVEKKINSLDEAVKVYKMTDQLLDRIKSEQTELQSKLFWRNDCKRLYENAIEACYLQKNFENAFYFFERSKAVLLQDQLHEQRLMDEEDIMKQTQLIKKNHQLEVSTENAEEIFINQQELDRLKQSIKEKNPLYYQSFVDTSFIYLQSVKQNLLKDRKALVELFAGDSATYILVITKEKSYLDKVNKTTFDSLSHVYTKYISDPNLLNKNSSNCIKLSSQLYQLIFKNINLPKGRIIISPDDKYFPFEALVTNTQPLTYFVEDYAVSYTYSARYLLNNFTTNSASDSYTFMGIAPVQYANGLPALPGSDQSVQRMQAYFSNATTLIGRKASRNNFLQQYYKYKIIQLYTHATDSGYTGEPMIYFSDSVLSLSDLFYENIPSTRLIVLSACETADGKLYNGEGVFSFNRQFATLGIPSCVSNLWQIDNQSTYRLTEFFYKYLSDGMPLDIALQKAKKEFIKTTTLSENKLPYYWAASILVGKTDAIPLSKKIEWKWIAGIVFLGALIFIWWGINRKINFMSA